MMHVSSLPRHSGENRNPERPLNWIPTFVGMTAFYIVIARFIRAVQIFFNLDSGVSRYGGGLV